MGRVETKGSNELEPSVSNASQRVERGTVIETAVDNGHLKKNFSIWSSFALGWNTMNIFGGVSLLSVIGFSAGGPPVLLYGFLGCAIGASCIMATFSECAAHISSPGGAYHYASFLTPLKYRRFVAYPIGWANYLGWMLITAACCAPLSSLLLSLINLCNPEVNALLRWRLWLGYVLWASVAYLWNSCAVRTIGKLEIAATNVSFFGFLTFTIALLVLGDKTTPEWVFVEVQNKTGYSSNSYAVVLGLASAANAFMALDTPAHLAEEVVNPKKVLPPVFLWTIGSQLFVGIGWILVISFTAKDLNAIVGTSTGVPIIEVVRLGTGSNAAAIVFNLILMFNFLAGSIASLTTASRQCLALARDGGMFFNQKLAVVSDRFETPIWSLAFTYFLLMLGYNALVGASSVFMILSFGSPAMIMLWTNRSQVPKGLNFHLGYAAYPLAIIASIYTIAVVILVLVNPITPVNMNYTCLVVGIFGSLIAISWLGVGRKNYKAPQAVALVD